jgi:hypothetical protein
MPFQNKTMFAYASYLIEQNFLDRVHINFLVTGHTHCENDQVYSSYSYALKRKTLFIGTPLGLEYYIQDVARGVSEKFVKGKVGHDEYVDEDDDSMTHYRRARIWKRINCVYDVVAMLKPYINSRIKYHQVPHCFM